MPRSWLDNGLVAKLATLPSVVAYDPEELRRRNTSAVAMDVLYVFMTAFFAYLLVQGFWQAVIATVPILGLLYFGWSSSKPFFVLQFVVVALTATGTILGVGPL